MNSVDTSTMENETMFEIKSKAFELCQSNLSIEDIGKFLGKYLVDRGRDRPTLRVSDYSFVIRDGVLIGVKNKNPRPWICIGPKDKVEAIKNNILSQEKQSAPVYDFQLDKAELNCLHNILERAHTAQQRVMKRSTCKRASAVYQRNLFYLDGIKDLIEKFSK